MYALRKKKGPEGPANEGVGADAGLSMKKKRGKGIALRKTHKGKMSVIAQDTATTKRSNSRTPGHVYPGKKKGKDFSKKVTGGDETFLPILGGGKGPYAQCRPKKSPWGK